MKLAIIDSQFSSFEYLKEDLNELHPTEVIYLYRNQSVYRNTFSPYTEHICKQFCVENKILFTVKELPIKDSILILKEFLSDCNRIIITSTMSGDSFSNECENIAWELGIPCKLLVNKIHQTPRKEDYTTIHLLKDNYFTRETRNNSFRCHSSEEEIYQFEELQDQQDCIILDTHSLYKLEDKRIHIVALDFEWLIQKIKEYEEVFYSESVDFQLSYIDCGKNYEVFSNNGYSGFKDKNVITSLDQKFNQFKGIERFMIDIYSHKEIDDFINKCRCIDGQV